MESLSSAARGTHSAAAGDADDEQMQLDVAGEARAFKEQAVEALRGMVQDRAEAIVEGVSLMVQRHSEHAVKSELGSMLNGARHVWSRQLERLAELPIVKKFEGRPLSSTMPPVTVALIMANVYMSWGMALAPLLGLTASSPTSALFHASIVLAMCSYHQGITTEPGFIPDGWEGEPTGMPRFVQEGGDSAFVPHERKKSGQYRYCNKERKFKPDRAHFCGAISKNVLRMDHYCPWLVNCVGYRNHKFFLLFLFYTVVASNTAGPELLFTTIHHGPFSAGHTFMMVQGAFLSSLLSAILTPFFFFHCWLLSSNLTTIEYCEKRGQDKGFTSMYHVGVFKNIRSIMGDDWRCWLFPIGRPPGNGIDWEVAPSHVSASVPAGASSSEDRNSQAPGGPSVKHKAGCPLQTLMTGLEAAESASSQAPMEGVASTDAGLPRQSTAWRQVPWVRQTVQTSDLVPATLTAGVMMAMRELRGDLTNYGANLSRLGVEKAQSCKRSVRDWCNLGRNAPVISTTVPKRLPTISTTVAAKTK